MSELDLVNIDTDKLFEQYTVSEILDIHKKIQVELDKKRQELRFMVGERYRDVITAADAIKSMQNSAEHLYHHIGGLNDKCHTLQSTINVEETKPVAVDKLKNFYRSVAIQIKILISIPEYIWMCLDNGDFLKAVHLFLLAIHIHTGLQLDTEHRIAETFTILSRLRLSINSFRNRILDGIRKRLQAVNLAPEEASNHLCAYMLLENKSQESVLSMFMALRQNALKDLLNEDISVHTVVRVQIINLMNCLICTILLIRSCFIGTDHVHSADGLVQIQMKQILACDAEKTLNLVDLDSSLLLEYLPTLVKNFRPSCTEGQTSLVKDTVEKSVNSWLQSTTDILNLNLSKSLELITSVKTLQTIREEAFKLESLDDWNIICTDTYLPNHFTVWQYFFQPLVSKRTERLICLKVENSVSYLYGKVDNAFASANTSEHSEKDLRWYVWSEDQQDLSRDSNNHEGLAMKTRGHSVRVVSLCKAMDEKYAELLHDVNIYLYGTQNDATTQVNSRSETSVERKYLEKHLRKEASTSIEKLVSYVEQIINQEPDTSGKVTKSVMAARLLQAVPQLCPNLVTSCSYSECQNDWDQVHAALVNRSLQFWHNWLNATKTSVEGILSEFMISIQYENMLRILPRWNTIDIEEQTDDKVFTSQIHIPSQPSVTLLSVLSEISGELNGILPHTLPKVVHTQFTEITADHILSRYETLAACESLNQNLALQFLLDVKFLTTMCVRRDNKDMTGKSRQICDAFRAKIDPFDLDVFYKYLQTNVKRSVLQSQTFFGCFLPAPAQLASLGNMDSKAVDNEPCIVALSVPSTDAWFPLLPVTAPILKTINIASIPPSPSVQVTKREPVTVVKDEPESVSGTTLRSGAAALFGAMTTDWFS
ncbi:Component of oligomeric golgi complex 1 [Carabus blaptoides fortunei]